MASILHNPIHPQAKKPSCTTDELYKDPRISPIYAEAPFGWVERLCTECGIATWSVIWDHLQYWALVLATKWIDDQLCLLYHQHTHIKHQNPFLILDLAITSLQPCCIQSIPSSGLFCLSIQANLCLQVQLSSRRHRSYCKPINIEPLQ